MTAQRTPTGSPIIGLGAHELDSRSVRLLLDLGVRHVRTTLYWHQWEANVDDHPRRFTTGVRRAADAGLEVLAVVHTPPPALNEPARWDQAVAAMARFLEVRTRQFRGAVKVWEIGNEQNVERQWLGGLLGLGRVSQFRIGANYAALLRQAHAAIKRRDPAAIVVSGGTGRDPREFLRGLFAGGAPADAIAVHVYGQPLAFTAAEVPRYGPGPLGLVSRQVREVQREFGDARPVWCTETGISDAAMHMAWKLTDPARLDDTQREQTQRVVERVTAERLYDRVYLHALHQPEDGGGIVRADWSPRPAYRWLQRWMRGGAR